MPKAPINGIELYYESHGDGPAVVFAHGRGGNHMSWWQQVPVISRNYRCITFDHRGWGQSSAPLDSIGPTAFVEDLKQLLDYLQVPQTFLVSQSMGGLACLNFALEHPERSLGLVLGDTTGGVGSPTVLEILKGVNSPAEGVRRSLAANFIESHPRMTFLYQQIGGLNPDLNADGVVNMFRSPAGPQASDLAHLSVPTMLIVGGEDIIFPPEVISAVHRLIPGSAMHVVPGSAHSTHFENPEEFNRLIGSFFAEVLAGGVAATAN